VRRDATLFKADLEKYGALTPDALYTIIYSGRGSMPGYGQGCEPKARCTFGPRLADEEVKALAEYVLSQAEAGWPAQ
jgi:cytochrome c6